MKQTLWCDACERNEPIDELSAAKWRVLIIDDFRKLVVSTSSVMLFVKSTPTRKRVCGDEGTLKLMSRWLSTGSMDPQRGAIADPPKQKVEA